MPSATMRRAAAMSRSGAAPHTRTRTSAPSAAASSTARRLSSIRASRSAGLAAGNIPPRHTLDTRSPASRTRRTARSSPVSASLFRHTAMYGTPWRAQASTASARLARSAVIWLKLSRAIAGGPGVRPPGGVTPPPPWPAPAASAPPPAPDRAAGRRDRVEDPQQRVAVSLPVPQDQPVVVKVVARVHAHALGQKRAHLDFALRVQERDLDPVDLGTMLADDPEARVHGLVQVPRPPVAGELGVEHVAEPVQYDGSAHLPQDGPVHPSIVVGGARRARQRPARHQDDPAAMPLDVADLLLVRLPDGVPGPAP